MLKQIPFKKEYLLVAATIILLLISYRFAFKKTIEVWQTNSDLKKRLSQSANVSYQPGYLERKNNNLDQIIGLYKADTANLRGYILSIISNIAESENVKLAEVPTRDPLFNNRFFIIQKLNFEGDYFSLIKVFNRLNSTKEIGRARSATLKVAGSENNGKAPKLVLEVYLEIVSK